MGDPQPQEGYSQTELEEHGQLVLNALERARDMQEALDIAELARETALEAGPLAAGLRHLRQEGLIREVAPGEFELTDVEDAVESGDEADNSSGLEDVKTAHRELGRAAVRGEGRAREIRLTAAVASALDPPALGKLVEAGILDAMGVGEDFVLVVTA